MSIEFICFPVYLLHLNTSVEAVKGRLAGISLEVAHKSLLITHSGVELLIDNF